VGVLCLKLIVKISSHTSLRAEIKSAKARAIQCGPNAHLAGGRESRYVGSPRLRLAFSNTPSGNLARPALVCRNFGLIGFGRTFHAADYLRLQVLPRFH